MRLIVHHTQAWLRAGLGLIYPENCQLCRRQRASPRDGFVCAECWRQVRFIRPPFCHRCGLPFAGELTASFECTNCRDLELHFRFARAAAIAKTVVLEAVHRFKYSRALWFENFLSDLLVREAAPVLAPQEWDFIVPVPLHPLKQREREFNQSELLAHCLAKVTRIPCRPKILRRILPTATQTLLSRDKRALNMKGAFAVAEGIRLKNKRIIVLDDILTTGATTNACARALRDAGAADVCVWTVARGL
jgi:competence protein ComFC